MVTFGSDAPVVDEWDVSNLIWTDTVTEKVYSDASNPGQSFTTGGNQAGYLLKSFAVQINSTSSTEPAPTGRFYNVRVISIDEAGATTTIAWETDHAQAGAWSAGDWMTWTLDSPVTLEPNSVYGIDIEHMTGGNWRNGIPYLRYNRTDGFDGGTYYRKADGDPAEVNADEGRDFVFHVDLDPANGKGNSGLSITHLERIEEGIWEVTLNGLPGTAYELRSDTGLAFDPGSLVENFTQENPALDPGTIGGVNDSVVTTDEFGQARVRMSFPNGSSGFLRAQLAP